MAANRDPQGILELDLNGTLISHRQIPLGPKENGGGCHGLEYIDGKLYIAALRLRGSDPHGLAWYNGALYSSDAGIHPGWPDDVSPTHGYIFRIDFVSLRSTSKRSFVPP